MKCAVCDKEMERSESEYEINYTCVCGHNDYIKIDPPINLKRLLLQEKLIHV